MKFQDWTARAVEDRIIEMADTSRLLPGVKGPKEFGNGMPEAVKRFDELELSKVARIKKRATGAAIDRMEQVWAWINALPDKADRDLIYAWSWVKVRKGMKISAFAEENDMNERTLRRAVTHVCQGIADTLNRKATVRLDEVDCAVSENERETQSQTVTSESCVKNWRQPDARPQIDTSLPRWRVIEPPVIRVRHNQPETPTPRAESQGAR